MEIVLISFLSENFFQPDSPSLSSLLITSSVKVFHCLQEVHLPSHFALSYPQLLQKKAVLILLIVKVNGLNGRKVKRPATRADLLLTNPLNSSTKLQNQVT